MSNLTFTASDVFMSNFVRGRYELLEEDSGIPPTFYVDSDLFNDFLKAILEEHGNALSLEVRGVTKDIGLNRFTIRHIAISLNGEHCGEVELTQDYHHSGRDMWMDFLMLWNERIKKKVQRPYNSRYVKRSSNLKKVLQIWHNDMHPVTWVEKMDARRENLNRSIGEARSDAAEAIRLATADCKKYLSDIFRAVPELNAKHGDRVARAELVMAFENYPDTHGFSICFADGFVNVRDNKTKIAKRYDELPTRFKEYVAMLKMQDDGTWLRGLGYRYSKDDYWIAWREDLYL